MREIYGFWQLASRLANPFGHPSQVRTQVPVLQTCVDLRRLASPFGQSLKGNSKIVSDVIFFRYLRFPNSTYSHFLANKILF